MRFLFCNEEESQDYFSLMHTSNNKTLQKNIKPHIHETEKPPRQSKYSKDDTEKDLYPWLDEKHPRRHISDKEILESIIDLSEACIAEKQKQALYKILLNT